MPKSDVIMDALSRYKPQELNQGSTFAGGNVFIVSNEGSTVYLDFPVSGGSGGNMSRRASKSFTARAWGRVTGGGITNYTITVQYIGFNSSGVGVVFPVLLSSPVPVAVDNESDNWYIEILLVWDSTSNKLNSSARTMVGNTWSATPVTGTQITGVDLDSGLRSALAISGGFSAGFTGNMSFLDGFQLEEN